MNYQEIHDKIIFRARIENRKKLKHEQSAYVYYESHHILPECIYPEYSNLKRYKWNKVLLTAREHFIIHQLLIKIYPKEKKLIFAAHKMTSCNKKQRRINNREYSWLKNKRSQMLSGSGNPMFGKRGKDNPRYGIKLSKETKIKMSFGSLGKNKGKIPWNKNRTKENDNRLERIGRNISKSKLGKKTGPHKKKRAPWSMEERLKRSKPLKIIKCPYCEICGGQNNMHRYHFDNCRNKKN